MIFSRPCVAIDIGPYLNLDIPPRAQRSHEDPEPMLHLKRVLLLLVAVLLAAVAAIAAATGLIVILYPEASAFSPTEAVGIATFGAVALVCLFLVHAVLKDSYRER